MRAGAFSLLVFFLIGIPVQSGWSQTSGTGTIAGTVADADDAHPLPHANIAVEGTHLGAASDSAGRFVISNVPPGRQTLVARLLGYEPWRSVALRVREDDTVYVNIRLSGTPIALKEIQVTAERERRLNDVRVSVMEVAPARSKTLAGVGEDVMRTLQSLPGVLAANDFSAQLVVRGSGPDQNLILMDGIEIFNPYRLYGMISAFNPETASEINLMTGGFPAKYGDRLSAVLDVTNREGERTAPLRGSINASITNANIVLEGGLPFSLPGSYMVSARRTYYDLILGPIAKKTGLVSGDVAFPNFLDIQSKIALDLAPGNKLVFSGLFSRDGVDLISGSNRESPDSVSVLDRTRNDVAGLTWHHVPSTSFYNKLGVSWYRNRGETEFGGEFVDPAQNRKEFENSHDNSRVRLYNVEFDSRYEFRKISFKNEAGWSLPGHAIETGISVDLLRTALVWHFRPDSTLQAILRSLNIAFLEDFVQTKDYPRTSVYLQDRISLGERLSIQPGLRFDRYQIIGRHYVQPRLNVLYRLDPVTTLRAAWGIYRQSPGYEKLLDQNAFLDLSNVFRGNLEAEKATHYVLGAERWLTPEWQLRLEGYVKEFDDVIVQQIVQGTVFRTSLVRGSDPRSPGSWTPPVAARGDSLTTLPVNGAAGRSYGIEIMLEKKNSGPDSRLSGWVGYTYARAERLRDGLWSPFRFDQRHTLDLVMDWRILSWLNVGIRWKYGTNFPYTEPLGMKPRVVMYSSGGVATPEIQVDRKGQVVFDVDRGTEASRFNKRLPVYHRLDVRTTAKSRFWGLDWEFYIDVINVYNRGNVIGYRFHQNEDLTMGKDAVTMLPLIPTLGLSARF